MVNPKESEIDELRWYGTEIRLGKQIKINAVWTIYHKECLGGRIKVMSIRKVNKEKFR